MVIFCNVGFVKFLINCCESLLFERETAICTIKSAARKYEIIVYIPSGKFIEMLSFIS